MKRVVIGAVILTAAVSLCVNGSTINVLYKSENPAGQGVVASNPFLSRVPGHSLIAGVTGSVSLPAAVDGEIAEAAAEVDAQNIIATILRLQAFGTRQSCSTNAPPGRGVNAARDWIFNQFAAIPGLQVRLDPFVHAGCIGAPTFNVIAWLPGTTHPERLVVIGGHYDSRTVNRDDVISDAPGANDAGSQSALVLESARVLASHRFADTLVFITFSGEEQGLIGSGELAANLDRYFNSPRVVAMLNADIVGGDTTVNGPAELRQFRLYSPGTPRELFSLDPDGTTDNTSPSRGLMRYVGSITASYLPSMEMLPKLREDRPGRGSDHRSFIRQGFPGIRFMETFECSPSPVDNSCFGATPPTAPCPPPAFLPDICRSFITSHQHSPNDLADFVTPDYAARVTRIAAATAATLARAPAAPLEFQAAGDALHGAFVTWAAPAGNNVDHFIIAARSTGENFYRSRISVPAGTMSRNVLPRELGFVGGENFFISVSAVDASGHESLFAYPEFRCDAVSCVVPPGANNIIAPE